MTTCLPPVFEGGGEFGIFPNLESQSLYKEESSEFSQVPQLLHGRTIKGELAPRFALCFAYSLYLEGKEGSEFSQVPELI